jgi:hypothetical protein
VMPRGAEFRRRAQECYRLSTQLHQSEHRSFALELAKAWIGLAEDHERKAPALTDPVGEAADATIMMIAQSEMERLPDEQIE